MTNTDRLAQALRECLARLLDTEHNGTEAKDPVPAIRKGRAALAEYESTRAALASLAPAAVEGDDISWRVKWLRQARINNADETDNKWLLELADRVAALTAQCEGLRKALREIDEECGACHPSHDPGMPYHSVCRIQKVARAAIATGKAT